MPDDLTTLVRPEFVLVAWAAGLALVSGSVALARVVGPGFTWLVASIAAAIGAVGVFAEDSWWARFGLILLALALVWARNRQMSGILQLFAGARSAHPGVVRWMGSRDLGRSGPRRRDRGDGSRALVSGGSEVAEMDVEDSRHRGHRRSRRRLDRALVAGLPSGGGTIAFWVLMATSVVLMGAVIGSLRYPEYAGVMAATGLSYLAVLTTLGGMFLGRALVAGLGPFAS